MDKEALLAFVRQHVWYQRFQLPHGITIGQMDSQEKWRRMRMPADFRGQSVLDLGCDLGWFCFQAKRQRAGHVLGVDIDAKSIEGARTLSEMFHLDVEFQVGDIEQLAVAPFDFVLLLSTLHRIGGTQPPYYTPIERQLTVLNKVARFVGDTFVLEFVPHGQAQKNHLETLFPVVEDLGVSITPEIHQRRILKCRRH